METVSLVPSQNVMTSSFVNFMVELELGACLYIYGHVQITLHNNFVFDEIFFFLQILRLNTLFNIM